MGAFRRRNDTLITIHSAQTLCAEIIRAGWMSWEVFGIPESCVQRLQISRKTKQVQMFAGLQGRCLQLHQ